VFKGRLLKPWQVISDLGDISCIAVGDVFNKSCNVIMVFAVDGCCSVIEFKKK